MSTSAMEIEIPFVENVAVSDDTLRVDLSDGRSISVPLAWYPRLSHASSAERKRWRLIGRGDAEARARAALLLFCLGQIAYVTAASPMLPALDCTL